MTVDVTPGTPTSAEANRMPTTTADELHPATTTEPDTDHDVTRTTPDATVDTEPTAKPVRTHSAVQVTTVIAVSVVAAVAAVVSFMHMYELAARAGEGWRAWLVPLAIDGLMVAASMTMVVRRRAGRSAGWLAWVSLTLGIAASLAANVAAAEPTLIGRAVAAWPPIALLLAYELLMDQIQVASKHRGAQRFAPATHPPMPAPAGTLHPGEPATAHDRAAMPATPAPGAALPPAAQPRPGTAPVTDVPNGSPVAAVVNTPAPTAVLMAVPNQDEKSSEAIRQAARQRYLKTLADGLPCSGRELADMFAMSERWGRYQIRAARRSLTATAHTAPTVPLSLNGSAPHVDHD